MTTANFSRSITVYPLVPPTWRFLSSFDRSCPLSNLSFRWLRYLIACDQHEDARSIGDDIEPSTNGDNLRIERFLPQRGAPLLLQARASLATFRNLETKPTHEPNLTLLCNLYTQRELFSRICQALFFTKKTSRWILEFVKVNRRYADVAPRS